MKSRLLSGVAGIFALAGAGAIALVGGTREANAFAYVFAGEANGVDVVTYAHGYNGVTGGNIVVDVAIDPGSSFAAQMVIPTQNVINTWNGKLPTTNNIQSGAVPGQIDFESVLLHEMGHALGLSHPNIGGGGANSNYTLSTDGANNTDDFNAGVDGIAGSADDIRGDDVNLNYFRKADNNPFATNLGVVDSTTYSRDIADLPVGDNYSANADRSVANALGFVDTESVLQQGTFVGEVQRDLGADDVAGLLYAEAGADGIAGTADDYVVTLNFLGFESDANADIWISFNNSMTSFALTQNSGSFIGLDDVVLTDSDIYFNDGSNWFFNQVSNEVVAEVGAPGAAALLGFGLFAMARRRRA